MESVDFPSKLTFLTPFDGGYASLKLQNLAPPQRSQSRDVHFPVVTAPLQGGLALGGGLDVETGSEGTVAGARQDDGTDVSVDGQLAEDGAQLEPHGPLEGVELLGAVDLDMGYEGTGVGNVEVGVLVVPGKG